MTLPRYAAYIGTGMEWLGDIPAGWRLTSLKRSIVSIEQGWSPQCENFPAEAPDDWAVLKVGCVNGGVFRPSENKVLPTELQPMQQYALRRGDLLISRANTRDLVGSAAVVPNDFPRLLLCDKLYRLRCELGTTCPAFVAYYLGTRQARSQIELAATGASDSMLNIGQSVVLELPIPSPPMAEQASIAAFLDRETAKIDALIAEQEKLIALLAEKRQATVSNAVTRGLNPNAPMKNSGVPWLGEVPAHWGVGRLRQIARVQTGVAKGKDLAGKKTIPVPYLRVANVQAGFLALEDVATIDIERDQLDRYRLLPGDVLMNEGGDFDKLGRGAVWSGEIEDCIHQNHVFAVRPTEVGGEWVSALIAAQYARFYFMTRSKQSTNLASISASNLMELPVLLPPDAERRTILEFISDEYQRLDALHRAAQCAIDLLAERRSALITAAVTGQIDVRGLVSTPAAEPEPLAA